MKRQQLVSAVLWLLAITDAIYQGLMASCVTIPDVGFNAIGLLIIIMPLVFILVEPLWSRGHPFDAKLVREWVNRRFGPETYESYTRAIRPLLLLAAFLSSIGVTTIANALRTGADQSAYVLGGFFLSGSAGFLIRRAVLHEQGNTIE